MKPEEACLLKKTYETREVAEASLPLNHYVLSNEKRVMEVYQCPACHYWHAKTKKTRESMKGMKPQRTQLRSQRNEEVMPNA